MGFVLWRCQRLWRMVYDTLNPPESRARLFRPGSLSAELRHVGKDDLYRERFKAADTELPATAIVAHPPEHAIALAVTAALRAANWAVVELPSVYELAVALAREPQAFAAALVAVDFCNREELRFFTMAKRRWPALRTAALAQPAFAFKADMADLAGADAMCTDPAQAETLVARINPTARPPPGPSVHRQAAFKEEPRGPRTVESMPPAPPTPTRESLRVLPDEIQPADRELPEVEPAAAVCAEARRETADVPEVPPAAQAVGLEELPWPPAPARKPPSVMATDGIGAAPQAQAAKPEPAPPRRPATPPAPAPQDILTEEEIAALMKDFDDEEDETPQR